MQNDNVALLDYAEEEEENKKTSSALIEELKQNNIKLESSNNQKIKECEIIKEKLNEKENQISDINKIIENNQADLLEYKQKMETLEGELKGKTNENIELKKQFEDCNMKCKETVNNRDNESKEMSLFLYNSIS